MLTRNISGKARPTTQCGGHTLLWGMHVPRTVMSRAGCAVPHMPCTLGPEDGFGDKPHT